MPRYKYIDTNPKFLPVDLARQLLPGTFEHALNHLLDHAIDLSAFDARFRNDETGAPAYPPTLLLKVVSRGLAEPAPAGVLFVAGTAQVGPPLVTIGLYVALIATGVLVIARWSRASGCWSPRHRLALAAGALVPQVGFALLQPSLVDVPRLVDVLGDLVFAGCVVFVVVRAWRRTAPM